MDDEMICLWREAFKISQLFVPGKYFNIWSGKYFLRKKLRNSQQYTTRQHGASA